MKSLLVAVFVFLVLTAAFSWPLVGHWTIRIPLGVNPNDPLALLYGVTSGAHALLTDPFHYFDATNFYPYANSLAFLDQIFGLCLLAAPVQAVSGNMLLAYNLVWMATFLLSALGAFLLVRSLTGSTAGGLLAGLIYAFQPFRWHNEGAINAIAIHWIPFALLCLHRWVWTDRLRWFLGFMALSALQFLSSGYAGVFLALAALLYFVTLLGADRHHLFGLIRTQHRRAGLVVIATAILLIPFVSPTLYNLEHGYGPERSLGETVLWSARPADFLTPTPGGILARVMPHLPSARHPLFPGFIVVFLVWSWIARRSWKPHPHRVNMIFYVVLLFTGMVLALGPALSLWGLRIPLPFAAFHYAFPGASLMRAAVRFAFLASLGLAVLAGTSLAGLLDRRAKTGRARFLWSAILICLVGIELYPGPPVLFAPLPGNVPAVYQRLAADPAPYVLAELPMPVSEPMETPEDALPQLYSLFHGKRLVNGIAAYVPPITRELRVLLQRFPEPDTIARLRELGVDLVILHLDRYAPAAVAPLLAAVETAPGIEVVSREPSVWVLRVRREGA